jgi:hypothetical protein
MVTHNPLHRSRRAALPHRAPALGDDGEASPRMQFRPGIEGLRSRIHTFRPPILAPLRRPPRVPAPAGYPFLAPCIPKPCGPCFTPNEPQPAGNNTSLMKHHSWKVIAPPRSAARTVNMCALRPEPSPEHPSAAQISSLPTSHNKREGRPGKTWRLPPGPLQAAIRRVTTARSPLQIRPLLAGFLTLLPVRRNFRQ